ncbi:MAG: sulfatase/phosphatase domain-containing protein, partial [Eubacterium sp.]
MYDDTIIIYTSDHGSHFKTRNPNKRSCHESATHTPLIIKGGKFVGGKKEERLSSLIDLPPTLLSMANIPIPRTYMGVDLGKQVDNPDDKRDCVFIQISEASNSRAVRTDRFKYEVRDAAITGYVHHKSKVYFENYLYDLQKDPNEKNNLIKDPRYAHVRQELKFLLLKQMQNAQEE